ncbi:Putative acyl-CoA N-acyltransferase, acyltransferase MbtK/IucB-like domain-containing protein [Septoria linicola]|uniref:Acyl-CoA N-acyltransferase, acyltransferase MbtK/IucB-like domain-containing protein n=1 Tax=Septoria linicola TaxID=215465 RepID=A0A9Q9AQ89_9PEZI|nr:putative acyl-CoA N-acyltransferase, acyltransferase MbtK/IucB-like domain-containing protein [Septoria linicola]USW52494.1 Putative acyl-CoA N-acyltransferase, acyltransferase MbtK/IucB-like domain-containing protein [Septoria linicola]
MAPNQVHLPNGQTLNVTPVFGGLYFKSNDLSHHHNVFPPGWTIILNCEEDEESEQQGQDGHSDADATPRAERESAPQKKQGIHRYRQPSLRNDHLYISSISNPASTEFKPPTSPTRQIAMMLWASLYWYFHQKEPEPQWSTSASEQTPQAGKPKGEWRIYINKEGIFKSKHVLPKLERMGLIASEDSSVGLDPMDALRHPSDGWTKMFVSRRSFWQMDPRIYLFTLTPMQTNSPYPSLSPAGSRPSSPNRGTRIHDTEGGSNRRETAATQSAGISRVGTPPGPFHSSSHLPTYYPPPPLQYGFTNNCRHPIRPKPPRQGETFYIRYIPSLGQYLTFRVASLSKRPITYSGPFSQAGPEGSLTSGRDILRHHASHSDPSVPTINTVGSSEPRETTSMTDVELLHKWMNDSRVAYSWGEEGPLSHQEAFLKGGLTSKHSIPVIGCFDGNPFGYFEMYWVKEDKLAGYLGGAADDFDRGLHVLVGEQEFRGQHRFKVWMSALVHCCWLADSRTNVVMMEPRVDNAKIRQYLEDVGFYKEREISFPHKQSNLMKIRREAWQAPAI